MQADSQIREIPVNEIQLISWISGRSDDDPEALQLDQLQQSMQSPTVPTSGVGPVPKPGEVPGAPKPIPANLHDALETSLLSIPIGQLAPIRVLKFPQEVDHLRFYGLIFGLRRLSAARAAGHKTIQAQVITLDQSEYVNPSIRFRIMVMAFCDNYSHIPLKQGDFIKALRALAACYHAIHPLAAKKSLPVRNEQGRYSGGIHKPKSEHSFAETLAEHKNMGTRTAERYLQLAQHACDTTLDLLSDGAITQTAAVALLQAPPDQQPAILQQLSEQHLPFTPANITRFIASRNNNSPAGATMAPAGELSSHEAPPDLQVFKYATRHAINLRNTHRWTPQVALQSIDVIAQATIALELLEEHLRPYANEASGVPRQRRTGTTRTQHQEAAA